MKRTLVLCLSLCLSVAVVACGGDDTAPPAQGGNNGGADLGSDADPIIDEDLGANNGQNNGGTNNGGTNNGAEDMGTPDALPEDMGGPDVTPEDMGTPDAPPEDMGVPTDPGGECDPFGQDCPEVEGNARQCIPVNGVPTCVNQRQTTVGEDQPCEGAPDCAPGLTCINWSDGRGQLCTTMCDRVDGAQCGAEKVCGAWIQSNPAIGLCTPRPSTCDIYAQDCPGDADACTFGRDPETNEPVFVCEPSGPQGQGAICSGGNGRCMEGLICIREEDDMSRCHKVCQDDDACDFEAQTCSGRSSTWQVTFCR